MPTDTPAAAPSPLAAEIARQFADSEDEEMLTAIIDAKLKPVREAMEYGLAWTMLSPTDQAEKKMRDALASLSPQPPEAPR